MSKNHARMEMDLEFGSAKLYGSSRSMVRRIATNLPLAPCHRVHFQLQSFTFGAAARVPGTVGGSGLVASLADVGWIDQEESDVSDKTKWEVESGLVFRSQHWQPIRRQHSLTSLHGTAGTPQSQALISDEAIQKISVLENELAKLRAQIAQIVQAQELNTRSASMAPGGPPALPPPPPPLPPPPPPPGPGMQKSISAIDLIKERRCKKAEQQTVVEPGPKQSEIPNMLDVLKDIGKVKLRSVKNRAEGHSKPKAGEPADAAALIAEALKRKFAHRYDGDSECEGNFSLPPQESKPHPEAPTFGQHMLKSTGKRKLF